MLLALSLLFTVHPVFIYFICGTVVLVVNLQLHSYWASSVMLGYIYSLPIVFNLRHSLTKLLTVVLTSTSHAARVTALCYQAQFVTRQDLISSLGWH